MPLTCNRAVKLRCTTSLTLTPEGLLCVGVHPRPPLGKGMVGALLLPLCVVLDHTPREGRGGVAKTLGISRHTDLAVLAPRSLISVAGEMTSLHWKCP